jgi:hypothetical protein
MTMNTPRKKLPPPNGIGVVILLRTHKLVTRVQILKEKIQVMRLRRELNEYQRDQFMENLGIAPMSRQLQFHASLLPFNVTMKNVA